MARQALAFKESFCARLKDARSAAGLNQAALAHRLGLERETYAKYESRSLLPHDLLPQTAKTLGVSIAYLLTGKDGDSPLPAAPVQDPEIIETANDSFTLIPVFDVRAAAGAGAFADSEDILYHHPLRSQWLARLTTAPAAMLALIEVDGDSMWPTLHSGDHVLLNRAETWYSRDGIYALDIGDGLQIKRLAMHPVTRGITVKSDNPDYPSFEGIDASELRILGRAIWLGRKI